MSDSEHINAEKPAASFQDGVYQLRGRSIRTGTYKSGRWANRPYVRFLYALDQGPTELVVSQMLPWVPKIGFFTPNFKTATGLTLPEFMAACDDQNLTTKPQRRQYLVSQFEGVLFEAEVKQQGQWLNVWKLRQRLGRPSALADVLADQGEEQTGGEDPRVAVPANDERTGDVSRDQPTSAALFELRAEAQRQELGDSELEELAVEEFGLGISRLAEGELLTLVDLLVERRTLS